MKQYNETKSMEIFGTFHKNIMSSCEGQIECYDSFPDSDSMEGIKTKFNVPDFSACPNLRATPEKFIDFICFKYFSFILEKK